MTPSTSYDPTLNAKDQEKYKKKCLMQTLNLKNFQNYPPPHSACKSSELFHYHFYPSTFFAQLGLPLRYPFLKNSVEGRNNVRYKILECNSFKRTANSKIGCRSKLVQLELKKGFTTL